MTLGCAQRSEVRSGSRPCENSDVELSRRTFVSITLNKKRTTLAGAVKRRKERKQFCAFSARGRFHTAWNAGTHNHRRVLMKKNAASARCLKSHLHGV